MLNFKVLTKDLNWVDVADVKIGEELLSFEEGKSPVTKFRDPKGRWLGQGGNRYVKPCVVTENSETVHECFRITFSDGSSIVARDDHYWLGKTSPKGVLTWIKTKDLIKRNAHVVKYMNVWEFDSSYKSGWLAGFIDGEGSLCYSSTYSVSGMQVCQRPTGVWVKALKFLAEYGIKHSVPNIKSISLGRGDCEYVYTNGKWETLEIIGKFDLVKFKETLTERPDGYGTLTSCGRPTFTISSLESVGEAVVCDLNTTVNTYFMNGFAVHSSIHSDFNNLKGETNENYNARFN